MQIELAKKYVVEVYSDQGSFDYKPWSTLGEFIELECSRCMQVGGR
jgi:hypothetical protein